ncbi:hypothetical protein AQZ50_13655 [Novosphingobium sp. Fuku2-ISO-50]|nr:hypothetical protein AQZ50_13655 [Novosphingobium sp. Fuku2-ISO-50]
MLTALVDGSDTDTTTPFSESNIAFVRTGAIVQIFKNFSKNKTDRQLQSQPYCNGNYQNLHNRLT